MNKTHFERAMEKLSLEKEDNILTLSKLAYDKLYEMRKYYFKLYLDAQDSGYKEASEVHYCKYRVVDTAIEEKQGNKEQALRLFNLKAELIIAKTE